MFEEIFTTLTSSPALMAIAAAIGLVCLWLGWNFNGMGAKRRETALKQELLAAKSSLLQLESTVRSRDQQAEHIQVESKELKKNNAELNLTLDNKDKEIRTTARQIHNLTSELDIVKGGSKEADSMIMDGFDDEVADDTPVESPLAGQLKKMETAYEKLKGALVKRDDRIDELEERLQNNTTAPDGIVDEEEGVSDEVAGEAVELRRQLVHRDEKIEDLHSQVTDLRQEKEMLEDIASRRSKTNRALKDAGAEIKERLPALEREIQAHESAIADHEASISRLLNDLQTAEKEGTRQQGEVLRLQTESEANSVELASKQDQVDQLQSSIGQREQQIASLNTALAESQQSVVNAERQLETAKHLAHEQDEQSQLTSGKLLAAEQSVAGLETDIDKRDQKLVRLTTEIEKVNGSLGTAQSQISESQAVSDKQMGSANDDLADARRQITQLKSEIEDQGANLSQQMQWMSKLKETLAERESRNGDLQEKADGLSAQLETSNEALKSAQTARKAIETENSTTERSVAENQAKIEEAESIVAEQQLSNSVYTNIIADRDSKIEALKQDLEQQQGAETSDPLPRETDLRPMGPVDSAEISTRPIGGNRGFTRHPMPRGRVHSFKMPRKSTVKAKPRNGRSRRASRSAMRG
jgi:chromosome segregation ATPase